MDFVHIILLFPLITFQPVLIYNDSLDAKIGKTDITCNVGLNSRIILREKCTNTLNSKESFVSVNEE